ncbi:hypothetical protein D3C85_1650860 [compost metagenome]
MAVCNSVGAPPNVSPQIAMLRSTMLGELLAIPITNIASAKTARLTSVSTRNPRSTHIPVTPMPTIDAIPKSIRTRSIRWPSPTETKNGAI